MSSRIRIKMGQIEVEYEGPEDFLKQELPDLLKAVSELYNAHPSAQQESVAPSTTPPNLSNFNTSSFAVKLVVKTGTQLIIAAAAKLTLVDRKDSFKRDELIAEMRSAQAYFKATYVNNLTAYLRAPNKSQV